MTVAKDLIPFRPRRVGVSMTCAEHEVELAKATPAQLELARTFQRLAFASQRRYDELALDRPCFEPAPRYLRQAVACDSNPDLHLQLIINLQKG